MSTAKELGIKDVPPETEMQHIADTSRCVSYWKCPHHHYEPEPVQKCPDLSLGGFGMPGPGDPFGRAGYKYLDDLYC